MHSKHYKMGKADARNGQPPLVRRSRDGQILVDTGPAWNWDDTQVQDYLEGYETYSDCCSSL